MKILIAFFMCVNLCYAATITMTTIEPSELGKCRKDFAVKLCKKYSDLYTCVKFRKNKQQYVTWAEIFSEDSRRNEIQRINRRDTLVWINHCIAIPVNGTISPLPLSQLDNRYQEKTIVIDLKQLAWGAYQYGKLINWGLANGGIGRCKETGLVQCKTPVGIWKILKKDGAVIKSSLYPVECKDKKVCGHTMFWRLKFKLDGSSLHGDKNLPGANISHGCVRLPKQDAKFINTKFAELGTTVVVLPY